VDIAALERDWLGRFPRLRDQEEFHGWEPYDLTGFGYLLDLAIPRARSLSFLDAGCGIGTKCLLAAAAGLAAEGVEHVPEYAAQARALGITVHEADVRGWPDYGRFGVVYVNCPLKDETAGAQFEKWLYGELAPAAVLIAVNRCTVPAGWVTVLDEPGEYRGVWVKP
jgi:SAM-dependent methyltransferase